MPSAVLFGAQSPNQAGAGWGRLAARHLGSTRLLGEPEQLREPPHVGSLSGGELPLMGWGRRALLGLGQTQPPCSLDRQPQKAFTLKSMGQLWARRTLCWDYPLPVPGFENILCPRASPALWCPRCGAYHRSSWLHSPPSPVPRCCGGSRSLTACFKPFFLQVSF